MGKIVYLMGKSSSGKDTLYRKLMEESEYQLTPVVLYTTRPIRDGEENGVEYFFTNEETFVKFRDEGKLIEERSYQTYHGIWRYFTADDGQLELNKTNYCMIGTLESYEKMIEFFGEEVLCPILVELDDGERLQRALDRERRQDNPKYQEMCRRFLADEEDFSEEKIAHAGIKKRFYNNDLQECFEEICSYVKQKLG